MLKTAAEQFVETVIYFFLSNLFNEQKIQKHSNWNINIL